MEPAHIDLTQSPDLVASGFQAFRLPDVVQTKSPEVLLCFRVATEEVPFSVATRLFSRSLESGA